MMKTWVEKPKPSKLDYTDFSVEGKVFLVKKNGCSDKEIVSKAV